MIQGAGIVGGIAAAMLLAACAPLSHDKSGADTIVLRLATVDGQVNSNGYQHAAAVFVRALPEVSGDRIQVDVTTAYGGAAADGESGLVEAIAGGSIDGGWPSTRAFARAGIAGLAAIEAPLTITSYDAQRALVEGAASGLVAANLERSGIRSLGLAVGPLRRPFGVAEFPLSLLKWEGMRFRVYNSPVQEESIAALGATAVRSGVGWPDLVAAGALDGVELDVAQYHANGLGSHAGKVVSNVVLWPEMAVLSLNQDLWDDLTDQQRGWVQEAADLAVQASVDGDYPDDEVAQQLCPRGVRFKPAGPGEVLAMREAVEPVIRQLASDEDESALLEAVQTAATLHPEPDEVTVEDSCTTEASLPDELSVPTTLAPIPSGVYRKQIEVADVAAAGLRNNDGTSGTWTLEVVDGRWYVSCRPLSSPGEDCGGTVDDSVLDAGWLRGDDREVWVVPDPEVLADAAGCTLPADGTGDHCNAQQPPTLLQWRLAGDDLVFSSPTLSRFFEMVLKPYVRID